MCIRFASYCCNWRWLRWKRSRKSNCDPLDFSDLSLWLKSYNSIILIYYNPDCIIFNNIYICVYLHWVKRVSFKEWGGENTLIQNPVAGQSNAQNLVFDHSLNELL